MDRRRCPDTVVEAARELGQQAGAIELHDRIRWIYNPLDYAWETHCSYLSKYARASCRVLFLGMNPGPWGMAQTGVPFGEIAVVREWLAIEGPVGRPDPEHPKRPIEGFSCSRSEVSGRRLWGLFRERFGSPESFFQHHFVANYCPLVFMEDSGRNLTPDKLPLAIRASLQEVCDAHLVRILEALQPEWLIGVGGFAERRARRVVEQHMHLRVRVGRILHPSPASPAANRDWAGTATRQLIEQHVWQ